MPLSRLTICLQFSLNYFTALRSENLPNEMPKRAWSSIERNLHVMVEVKDWAVRALWEMTGRLVRQPRRLPRARLHRRGVQWLYSRRVLPSTTKVRLLPRLP